MEKAWNYGRAAYSAFSQQYASYKKNNVIVDISCVWQLQSSLITFTMGTRSEPHGANIAHCVVLLTDGETAGLEMAREIGHASNIGR